MSNPRGAPSSRFRSRFLENMDSGILTSTYSEFDAYHEIGLLFGFGAFGGCGEHFEIWDSEFCMPNEKFREMTQASLLQQANLAWLT